MMAVCAMCGKRIVVHWPQFYVYKRRDKFFCGANCQEVFDVQETRERVGWIEDWQKRRDSAGNRARTAAGIPGSRTAHDSAHGPPSDEMRKGQEDRKKMKMFITPENRQKAVEIAIAGGNPLRYLEKCGAKNPSASWSFIKSNVKKNDPELFAKIPEKFGLEVDEHGMVVRKEKKGGPSAVPMPGTRVQLDPADLEAADPEKPRVVQDEKGVHLEEAANKEQAQTMGGVTMTMFGMPCKVTGIEVDGIEYQATGDSIRVRWPAMANMAPMGVTLMRKADWQRFAETLLKVMKYLGND